MREPPVTAPETFNGLMDAAQGFLAQLARRETGNGLEPKRARYLAAIRPPAERLTGIVAERLTQRTRRPHDGRIQCLRRGKPVAAGTEPHDARLRFRWTAAVCHPAPDWWCTVTAGSVAVSVGYRATAPDDVRRFQAMMAASGDLLRELLDWVGGPVFDQRTAGLPDGQAGPEATAGLGFTVTRTMPDDWRTRNDGFLGALEGEIRALMPISRFLADQL